MQLKICMHVLAPYLNSMILNNTLSDHVIRIITTPHTLKCTHTINLKYACVRTLYTHTLYTHSNKHRPQQCIILCVVFQLYQYKISNVNRYACTIYMYSYICGGMQVLAQLYCCTCICHSLCCCFLSYLLAKLFLQCSTSNSSDVLIRYCK